MTCDVLYSYDVIKLISMHSIHDSGVFIPVFIGAKDVEIDQEMREL